MRACIVPEPIAAPLAASHARRRRDLLEEPAPRDGRWLDLVMNELDRWPEDRRSSLKATLDELDVSLEAARKAARPAPTLPTGAPLDAFRELARPEGAIRGAQARVIAFDDPAGDDGLVANRFTAAENEHTRRPEVVLFVNGLPVAVLELENAPARRPPSGPPSSSS